MAQKLPTDMISKRNKYLYLGVLVFYISVIIVLATTENIDAVLPNHTLLKSKSHTIAHFCFFGGFAWLTLLGLNLDNGKAMNWKKSSYCVAFFYTFFFGVIVELLQTFTATRSARIDDVAINTLGISFALIIVLLHYKRQRKSARALSPVNS